MKFIHVGVGGFGQCWVKVLKENPDAEVVALVDVKDESLAKACEVGGYHKDICFKSLPEALKSVKADAVVSSTPPAFHKNDVVTALKAGLNVISEKPMSDNFASCKAMLKTAIETKRTYVVSQNYRYNAGMWTLANVIKSGKLGAIGQL